MILTDFFEYIQTFDIIFLFETHVEKSKISEYEKYFTGFDIFWKYATRKSIFGRASGGCLYGVKKQLKNVGVSYSFKQIDRLDVLKITINRNHFHLIPLYLRPNEWNDDFAMVSNCLSNNNLENVIVAGDLNVRVGNLQTKIAETYLNNINRIFEDRQSRDLIVNQKGKKLIDLCENVGLFLLNGSTEDDKVGNYTFVSAVGKSVNDICAVDQEILWLIEKFQVDYKLWSDHMPLNFSLKCEFQYNDKSKQLATGKFKFNMSRITNFQSDLTLAINELCSQNSAISIQKLNDILMQTHPKEKPASKLHSNEKWFNWDCIAARKESFRKLRRFRRTNSEADRILYVEENKKYHILCTQTKSNYFENIERKLNSVKDSKEWWQLVRELKTDKRTVTSEIEVSEFRLYFSKLLNPVGIPATVSYAPSFITSDLLDSPITVIEIQNMLKSTKDGKSAGEDKLTYEFYKYSTVEFQELLAQSFNYIYENGLYDECFKISILFPIFKKGDRSIVSNYRGISFMNCVAKILMGVLTERLTVWVTQNKTINEFQAGFRRKYSTVDNVYNLCAIVNLKLNEKKKVYAFFVDFRAAFDKVSRQQLFYKLNTLGISTKFVNFIRCIYKTTKFKVWSGKDYSEEFETIIGLKQGCLMSPILFSLYMNDLHDCLKGGLYIDDLNVRVLLYADDIVILADDVDVLQKMIWKLEEYCDTWNMEVNLDKSAIMVFRNGGRLSTNEKLKFKGNYIYITTEYTYLRVILTPKLSFQKHLESRNAMTKSGINSLWKEFLGNDSVSLSAKYKMFDAVSRSIQCYAGQIWGYCMFETVDKLQMYFIKKILRLPDCTPTYGLILETGINNTHFYALQLHMNFVRKTLFEYSEDRLPKKLSVKIIQKGIFWITNLNRLGDRFGINFDSSDTNVSWQHKTNLLIVNLQKAYRDGMWEKAMASSRIYKDLDHNVGGSYIMNQLERYKITWIFKCRVDLIILNKNTICSLCNLNEFETLQHFIGRCAILKRIRTFYYGKTYLTNENIIDCLNGVNDSSWSKLVGFVTDALKYRLYIINEFN